MLGVQAILVTLRDVGPVDRESTGNGLAGMMIPEACLVLVRVWCRLGLVVGGSARDGDGIACLSGLLRYASCLCSAHGGGEHGSWEEGGREKTETAKARTPWGGTQHKPEGM